MVSPAVLAANLFAVVWLVVKYRYLIRQTDRLFALVATLAPALLVALSLAVVPYVEIRGSAWCSQVEVDRLSSAVLLLGALVPVFDETKAWPGIGCVSSVLTAAFLFRSECYGVATVLIAAATCSAMFLLQHWKLERTQKY